MIDVSPEEALLLCAARARVDDEIAGRLRSLLRRNIDWPALIRAARSHRLLPLLYWNFHQISPELLPEDARIELREHFLRNSARNLRLAAELIRILMLFDDRGIAAIPFKGLVQAESIYADLALREVDDLDILVPESKIDEADAVLRSEGYKPALEVPANRVASYRRMQHEMLYGDENQEIYIELHWKIASVYFPFTIDIETVWERVEWLPLLGSRVRSLAKEDELLILCAHGAKHLWERLEWVGAVAELVRVNPQLNWTRIVARARALHGERILLFGLWMANSLFGTVLPVQIREKMLHESGLRRLVADTRRRLFAPHAGRLSAVQHCCHWARLADRLRDGFQVILKVILLPTLEDWKRFDLPVYLSGLYYPIHVFRLLKKLKAPCARASSRRGRPRNRAEIAA